MNNSETMFGIQKLPTDNQVRNMLDPVDPKLLPPVFTSTFHGFEKLFLGEIP